MPTVSWSEVKLYRKCSKAHDYKYYQKLRRKKKALPLIKGSILHDMLDALVTHRKYKNYIGPDPWEVLGNYEEKYREMFEAEQEVYGTLIEDCTAIFDGYMRKWKNDPLEYEESEVFVATDLAKNLRFIGYIDKIAKYNGLRWVVDHKFVKSIPGDDDRFVELQLLMYAWAWNRFNPGRPVSGIIWDYARTKVPVMPEVLKRGGLSKRKNMDTDVATYKQAIRINGLDEEDYIDILQDLEGKDETFFQRYKLPLPTKHTEDIIVNDFRTTALKIQTMKGIAERSMGQFNCKNCDYRLLCEAEVRGHDADYIKKVNYYLSEGHGRDDDANKKEG